MSYHIAFLHDKEITWEAWELRGTVEEEKKIAKQIKWTFIEHLLDSLAMFKNFCDGKNVLSSHMWLLVTGIYLVWL